MITADTFRLDGRLALVTGPSSGIGLALVRGLGQAGDALVLNGRDAAKLTATATATATATTLRAESLTVHEAAFDATDGAASESAVARIEADHGAIEILVDNAGLQRRGAFDDFLPADWQAVMRTNVDSMFFVGQATCRRRRCSWPAMPGASSTAISCTSMAASPQRCDPPPMHLRHHPDLRPH